MKRYVKSSDDPWEQTHLIKDRVLKAVKDIENADSDNLNYTTVKRACDAFWTDYDKFPTNNGWISDSIKYDTDKGTFYRKYINFATKCRELVKYMNNISGYGRDDYQKIQIRKELRGVADNFPFGWKSYRSVNSGTGVGGHTRYVLIDYPDRTPICDIDTGARYSFDTEEKAEQFIEDNPYFKKKYPGLRVSSKHEYSVYHN